MSIRPIQTSSMDDMANNLYCNLDRSKIFPPHYNKPEDLINSSSPGSRVRRPPNGFLICRKNVHKEANRRGICNMRVISKVTGMLWRDASPEEKNDYEKLASQVNKLHSEMYPGYKYQPSSRVRYPNNSPANSSPYHPYDPTPSPIATQTQVPNYYPIPLFQSFTPEKSIYPYSQYDPDPNHFFWRGNTHE